MQDRRRLHTDHLVRVILEHPFGAGIEDADDSIRIRRDDRHFGGGVEHALQSRLGVRQLDEPAFEVRVQNPYLPEPRPVGLPEIDRGGDETRDERAPEQQEVREIRPGGQSPSHTELPGQTGDGALERPDINARIRDAGDPADNVARVDGQADMTPVRISLETVVEESSRIQGREEEGPGRGPAQADNHLRQCVVQHDRGDHAVRGRASRRLLRQPERDVARFRPDRGAWAVWLAEDLDSASILVDPPDPRELGIVPEVEPDVPFTWSGAIHCPTFVQPREREDEVVDAARHHIRDVGGRRA